MTQQLFPGHISLTCYPSAKNNGVNPATAEHDQRLTTLAFGSEAGLNASEVIERKKTRIVISAASWLQSGIFLGASTDEVVTNLERAAKRGFLGAYKSLYRFGNSTAPKETDGYGLIKLLTKIGRQDLTALIAVPGAHARRVFEIQA